MKLTLYCAPVACSLVTLSDTEIKAISIMAWCASGIHRHLKQVQAEFAKAA